MFSPPEEIRGGSHRPVGTFGTALTARGERLSSNSAPAEAVWRRTSSPISRSRSRIARQECWPSAGESTPTASTWSQTCGPCASVASSTSFWSTTPSCMQQNLLTCVPRSATAAAHCRPDGIVAVLPDVVRETFAPGTDEGGHDASDGRGLRYLEWSWDPDPTDDTYVVDYAFLLRDATGVVQVLHDRHVEGLFPRSSWLGWFEEAGLTVESSIDRWNREVFIARPAGR